MRVAAIALVALAACGTVPSSEPPPAPHGCADGAPRPPPAPCTREACRDAALQCGLAPLSAPKIGRCIEAFGPPEDDAAWDACVEACRRDDFGGELACVRSIADVCVDGEFPWRDRDASLVLMDCLCPRLLMLQRERPGSDWDLVCEGRRDLCLEGCPFDTAEACFACASACEEARERCRTEHPP